MLSFQKDIISSLSAKGQDDERSEDGGLVILSRGLGNRSVIEGFVREHASQSTIIFILNLSQAETDTINSNLLLSGHEFQVRVITSELGIKERQKLYIGGGCFSVTRRILIVDLLTDIIPVDLISGLIVNNAHRVKESTTEAFIIQVFRSKSNGFIKAISDDARSFVKGFTKIEKAMQALRVTKLILYPRFHVQVNKDLEKNSPEIIELYPTLTDDMKSIQKALGEVITACVADLKSRNRSALADVTLEDALFRSLGLRVRAALNPIWNKVTPHSRTLVRDLGTLTELMERLLSMDSLAFYRTIMALRASKARERHGLGGAGKSLWMLTKGANLLFSKARDRVFKIPMESGPLSTLLKRLRKKGGVTMVLEENPKWSVLLEVMSEISEDLAEDVKMEQEKTKTKENVNTKDASQGSSSKNQTTRLEASSRDDVKKDKKEKKGTEKKKLEQKRDNSGKNEVKTMSSRENAIDLSLESGASSDFSASLDTSEKVSSRQVEDLTSPQIVNAAKTTQGSKSRKSNARALIIVRDSMTAYVLTKYLRNPKNYLKSRWKDYLFEYHKKRKPFTFDPKKPYLPAQRSAIAQRLGMDIAAENIIMDYKQSKDEARSRRGKAEASFSSIVDISEENEKEELKVDLSEWKRRTITKKGVTYLVHGAEDADYILCAFEPRVVVCFDPSISVLRTVEIYHARRPAHIPPIKIYFLAHADSVETQRYSASVNRERKAFEKLIEQHSCLAVLLPPPTGEQMSIHPEDTKAILGAASAAFEPQADSRSLEFDRRTLLSNALTRRGGKSSKRRPRVVVDVREFRSALPFFLYQRGMEVVPVTLEVGDYILSPGIAVERKSISDLKGGLASGRLHRQLQVLCKSYKRPVLLIEFSRGGPFGFDRTYHRDGISIQDMTSKLVLLCLHFPNVRLLWSKGPSFTAELFSSLKKGEAEPELDTAISVGTDKDSSGDVDSDLPREILLQIPGISINNVRKVINNVQSLWELTNMAEGDIAQLVGPAAAKKVYDFLNVDVKVSKKSSSTKSKK
mmetsp:Transcript_2511/g.3624  ORF Transcript_2511/g.3624 Transcript_2511/m.3624 type:complete len:1030 (-) Transcript_2511:85-3174(-)